MTPRQNKIVRNRYDSIQARMKRLKLPRAPFTFDQFFYHVLAQLGPNLVSLCRYDRVPISIETAVWDHSTPLKRGGGLGLTNLDAICDRCNSIKGGLTPDEYRAYIAFRNTLHPAAQADLDERLQKAVKSLAGNWYRKTKTQNPGGNHVPSM